MSIMDEYVQAFILHYSDIHDKEVSNMIRSGIVPSEADAKKLLSFIDVLFKYSKIDMKEKRIVLGEPANSYDAEKAAMAILEVLEYNKFNSLVDRWH